MRVLNEQTVTDSDKLTDGIADRQSIKSYNSRALPETKTSSPENYHQEKHIGMDVGAFKQM